MNKQKPLLTSEEVLQELRRTLTREETLEAIKLREEHEKKVMADGRAFIEELFSPAKQQQAKTA